MEGALWIDEVGVVAVVAVEMFAREFEPQLASKAPGAVAETVDHPWRPIVCCTVDYRA